MRPAFVPFALLLAACAVDPAPESTARELLGAPDDLELISTRESLAGRHLRFAQLAPDGTRVLGAVATVHLAGTAPGAGPAPRVLRVTSNLVRPIRLDGARVVDGAGAARAAAPGAEVLLVEPAAVPVGHGRARAGWRAIVESPGASTELWLDGETGAVLARHDLRRFVDGMGQVYLPNPLTTSGDMTLADANDADSPALTAMRVMVPLRELDGSGVLRGAYADVSSKGQRASEPSLVFDYTRADDRFEEVSAYFHIDRAQRHLQALGYTGPKAILAVPFQVIANSSNQDNSFYSSATKRVELGAGGVDDGEDGDVVVHEYGHAVIDDIAPGFGGGESGALGEGFGDILAASTPTGAAAVVERACVAPWDAIAYTPPPPPFGCLRRVDGQKHYPEHLVGEVHDDGEIWSGAIWEMYAATGLAPEQGLALVVESLFMLGAGDTLADSAALMIVADQALHGGAHVDAMRRAFTWHGLLADITPPAPFEGEITAVPLTVESAHPIADGDDQVQMIEHPGAGAIRVHFASFSMETDATCVGGLCDAVYLYDGEGRLYARLGGALGAFDAPAIPGDTVIVRWVSDGNVGSQGFQIDRYDVIAAAPAVPDAGTGGAPDAGPGGGGGDGGDDEGDGGGCGCRAGGAPGGRASAGLVLGLLGLALVRARRRRSFTS